MRRTILSLLLLSTSLPAYCAPTAKDAWKDVIKACANSDLLGKNVLFLGPTNLVAPGTVLRKRDPKGYGIVWLPSDIKFPANAVTTGNEIPCSGNASKNFNLGIDLTTDNTGAPATGSLSVGIKRGRTTTVTITGLRWDTVVEGPYAAWIDNGASQAIKQSLRVANPAEIKQVLLRGLLVEGFKAEIDYDNSVGVDVKAKVPDGNIPISGLGANLTAKWTGTTKLTISSEKPFYVAGELANYGPGGISGSDSSAKATIGFGIRKPILQNIDDAHLEPRRNSQK